MGHGGLLPPPFALHLFPRAGLTCAVHLHRASPRHLPLHRCSHCKGIHCTCMPPLSWDDTGASLRPRIPLPLVLCCRMHVRCPHLRSSFLGSLLLISPIAFSTTDYRMQQPTAPHDGETLHAIWANPGATTRRIETGSSPTQVWAIHSWTECACIIGRSGFQLLIASALTAPPRQGKEITIRGT